MLRYGGHVLNLRTLITNGLSTEDLFTMLALEQGNAGQNQKVFAVCKRSVAVSTEYVDSISKQFLREHTRYVSKTKHSLM